MSRKSRPRGRQIKFYCADDTHVCAHSIAGAIYCTFYKRPLRNKEGKVIPCRKCRVEGQKEYK